MYRKFLNPTQFSLEHQLFNLIAGYMFQSIMTFKDWGLMTVYVVSAGYPKKAREACKHTPVQYTVLD